MEPQKAPPEGGFRSDRAPLLIENVYEKETTESFVERHFRNRSLHRCRSVAEFDVDALAEQFASSLIRSAQALEINPDGQGHRPNWTMLVFQPGPSIFWYFLIKTDNSYGAKTPEKLFTLIVTSDSPTKAADDALMLQKHFTQTDDSPGFLMLRDLRHPKRIPLKPEYALSDELLDLHYGPGFAGWSQRFADGLNQNGLSILRGKPGTGKTSFLRHLIYTLSATHRFYYLPVDAFGLLQAQMADFLSREQRRFPEAILVLVLEDAEQLLLNRRDMRDGLASSLLNFTDGFVGDMVRTHLVCTINSEVKDLDEAVLRPGRQRFFREFDLLDFSQALALAEKLGVSLTEKRSYSLAEIYHFKDTQSSDRLNGAAQRPIGFAAG